MVSVKPLLCLAALVSTVHQILCQVPTFTPKNQLCWVIKENALRILGSNCFNTRSSTYLGRGNLKKHELVNYIFKSMGKPEQFPENNFWSAISGINVGTSDPVPAYGAWVPVTGPAMIGDLVIGRNRMVHIVVSVGVKPVLVNKGRVVFKRNVPLSFFNPMRRQAVQTGWSDCLQTPGVDDMLITPANPDPPCSSWTIDQARVAQTTGFVAKWRLMRIDRFRGPRISGTVNGNHVVYRYIEPPKECSVYAGQQFARVSAALGLPSCPGTDFTASVIVRDQEGISLTTPPLTLSDAFAFPAGMSPTHSIYFLVNGYNDDGSWMRSGPNDGLLPRLISNGGFSEVNYVLVQWTGPSEHQALSNLPAMAYSLAMMMNKFIADFSSTPDKITCIGMGIGAHYCGEAGRLVTAGRIGRVSGLNPSSNTLLQGRGLGPDSAIYVDVIHSETTTYGTVVPMGHDDYYPNKGIDQPACVADPACSHTTSATYWYANINTLGNNCLTSVQCSDVNDLQNTCTGSAGPNMGVTTTTAVGGIWDVAVSSDPITWFCPNP